MPMFDVSMLPEDMRNVKPGDALTFTVSNVQDGQVELDYASAKMAPAAEPMAESSEMTDPKTREDAMKMDPAKLRQGYKVTDREAM